MCTNTHVYSEGIHDTHVYSTLHWMVYVSQCVTTVTVCVYIALIEVVFAIPL